MTTAQHDEEQMVATAYPEWRKLVMSAEFQDWFYNQPAKVRKLGGSPRATDAVYVIHRYLEWRNSIWQRIMRSLFR